ncbi:MAG: hypothetical protein MJZ89_00500 [Paludibacteraceae bacterium]|nr:hypothetical protein [Paludibacteraceae bacterium]
MKRLLYILIAAAMMLSCEREPQVTVRLDQTEVEVFMPETGAKEADFRCKLTYEKQPETVLWLDFRYLTDANRLKDNEFDITGTYVNNDMVQDGCKYTTDGQHFVFFHECAISIEQTADGRYRFKGKVRGDNGTSYLLNSVVKVSSFVIHEASPKEQADYSGEPADASTFALTAEACILSPYGDYYQCGINNYLVVLPATDGSILYVDLMGTSEPDDYGQLPTGTYTVGAYQSYAPMTLNHGDAGALAKYDITTYYLADESKGVKYWVTAGEMQIERDEAENCVIRANLTTANHSVIELQYTGEIITTE